MRASSVLVLAVGALAAAAAASGAHSGVAANRPGECTIAAPSSRATVETQLPYAQDFCELVSQALAGDVFRSPVIVTPERLWHYPGAIVSCRLRFHRAGFLTIRNSIATCRWLARRATGWQLEGPAGIGPSTQPSAGVSHA